MTHRTTEELLAGLDEIRRSPTDQGTVRLIVARPAEDQRAVLDEGELSVTEGLVGDDWRTRGSRSTPDGSANIEQQLNVMNARVAALLGGDEAGWPPAGDQLFLDLDLSTDNVPPGTRLALGSAVIEVTPKPHTGCAKFTRRFGLDAMRFVNAAEHEDLHLRGICAKVVEGGTVRVGEPVRKL